MGNELTSFTLRALYCPTDIHGQLYNVELSTVEAVKDPVRGAKK